MSALHDQDTDGYGGDLDDPIVNSPFALASTLNISIAYMLWYVIITHWNLANYVAWVRNNDALLGNYPSPKLYLAFVVLSEVLLWGVSGPLFFYAAKYRKSQKDRNYILFLGIAVFWLVSDVPLFAMDLAIIYYYDYQSVVQTTTMILRSISFFVGATLSWQMYVHRMSKFLYMRYENPEEQERLREQQQTEALRVAKGLKTDTKFLRQVVR
jgi:hypothetical protein